MGSTTSSKTMRTKKIKKEPPPGRQTGKAAKEYETLKLYHNKGENANE